MDRDRSALDVYVSDLPAGWRVGVISGAADEVGSSVLDPRVVLRDADGVVHAYSNPLWLLRSAPVAAVPDSRWVAPPPLNQLRG